MQISLKGPSPEPADKPSHRRNRRATLSPIKFRSVFEGTTLGDDDLSQDRWDIADHVTGDILEEMGVSFLEDETPSNSLELLPALPLHAEQKTSKVILFLLPPPPRITGPEAIDHDGCIMMMLMRQK